MSIKYLIEVFYFIGFYFKMYLFIIYSVLI